MVTYKDGPSTSHARSRRVCETKPKVIWAVFDPGGSLWRWIRSAESPEAARVTSTVYREVQVQTPSEEVAKSAAYCGAEIHRRPPIIRSMTFTKLCAPGMFRTNGVARLRFDRCTRFLPASRAFSHVLRKSPNDMHHDGGVSYHRIPLPCCRAVDDVATSPVT